MLQASLLDIVGTSLGYIGLGFMKDAGFFQVCDITISHSSSSISSSDAASVPHHLLRSPLHPHPQAEAKMVNNGTSNEGVNFKIMRRPQLGPSPG